MTTTTERAASSDQSDRERFSDILAGRAGCLPARRSADVGPTPQSTNPAIGQNGEPGAYAASDEGRSSGSTTPSASSSASSPAKEHSPCWTGPPSDD
jgi:hypothetical protein